MSSDYYGKGGRLSKTPNSFLIETAYQHDIEDSNELIEGLHIADIAHTIALLESNVIDLTVAQKLLKALVFQSENKINFSPHLGDVYNSKEFSLKQIIGKTAGWLHMGRARREAINNGFLIKYKSEVLKLMRNCHQLTTRLVQCSESHAHTLMPDFTYMLHAQPTSLGHYLGTTIGPLTRDIERIKCYYQRLDQSWAGIGSVNGSSLPLDRNLLGQLMGFSKVANHTRDAMWMPDIFNEGIFILSNILCMINRFVQELLVWNTSEFGYIDIDDEYARASVVMPQKKNPYALSYIRGLCNEVTGKVATYMMIGKEASGFPDNRIFIYGDIIRTYKKASNAILMFSDFFSKLSWRKKVMEKTVRNSFACSTDLAEIISLKCKVDYKTSHHIVGSAVSMIGHGYDDFAIAVLHSLEKQGILVSVDLKNVITEITNYKNLLEKRNGIGGSSPIALVAFLAQVKDILSEAEKWSEEKQLKFNSISTHINSKLEKILQDEFRPFKTTIKV